MVLICLGSRNASSQLGLKTEAALKTSKLSLNRRSNSRQHSVYCCKHVNFQDFAWATCSRTSLHDWWWHKECVQLGIGRDCPWRSFLSNSYTQSHDHDVSVQVEVHNGDKWQHLHFASVFTGKCVAHSVITWIFLYSLGRKFPLLPPPQITPLPFESLGAVSYCLPQ